MPAFKTILDDNEIWQISLLLKQANQLSSSVRDKLKGP
jgi:mono/diheme cytochrome c family protein